MSVITKDTPPCPFCHPKKTELRITDWCDDDGEYDAIECCECKGCAPADVWNKRKSETDSNQKKTARG